MTVIEREVTGTVATTGSSNVDAGTLVLAGSNSYAGGTTVSAGELYLTSADAIADGTNLTIGDGSAFLLPPAPAPGLGAGLAPAVQPVPEPGTFALLAAGGLWLLIRRRARRSVVLERSGKAE